MFLYVVDQFSFSCATRSVYALLIVDCIRVNAINPGAVRTKMRAEAFPAEDPKTLKNPKEVMNAYLFLMGKDSLDLSGRSIDAQ